MSSEKPHPLFRNHRQQGGYGEIISRNFWGNNFCRHPYSPPDLLIIPERLHTLISDEHSAIKEDIDDDICTYLLVLIIKFNVSLPKNDMNKTTPRVTSRILIGYVINNGSVRIIYLLILGFILIVSKILFNRRRLL